MHFCRCKTLQAISIELKIFFFFQNMCSFFSRSIVVVLWSSHFIKTQQSRTSAASVQFCVCKWNTDPSHIHTHSRLMEEWRRAEVISEQLCIIPVHVLLEASEAELGFYPGERCLWQFPSSLWTSSVCEEPLSRRRRCCLSPSSFSGSNQLRKNIWASCSVGKSGSVRAKLHVPLRLSSTSFSSSLF